MPKKTKKKVKKVGKVKPLDRARGKKEKPVGMVTHYYRKIKVAVVRFSKTLPLGAKVEFRGATTKFSQKLSSAQYDHKPLLKIPKGKQVGLKVQKRVRGGDKVYLGR